MPSFSVFNAHEDFLMDLDQNMYKMLRHLKYLNDTINDLRNFDKIDAQHVLDRFF